MDRRRQGLQQDRSLFTVISFPFGSAAVVWRKTAGKPRIQRIFLEETLSPVRKARQQFPGVKSSSGEDIAEILERMRLFLRGQSVTFSLEGIALERCGRFQRKILQAESRIPRGWVSTYGRLAARIGVGGGGRAAGKALAENPFPILIPCHRTVRADGTLGGFQGGVRMKREFLEMEGTVFSGDGRVVMKNVYY
ncbi:MAG: methylated-DNA--[protein]-cysteine S-methyltransferase [Anaerolineales bacterium]|nr:methylated-DNA--[protein]-cysteine S-methyltransferase [Anaerolineales bacterium]